METNLSNRIQATLLAIFTVGLVLLAVWNFRQESEYPQLQDGVWWSEAPNGSGLIAEKVLPKLDIRYDGHEYRRDVNPFGLIEFLFRKGAHLFVYGVLAASAALALRQFRLRQPAVAGLALTAVLIVATLDEWNQRYSQARTPAYQDVLVDLTGGAISLLVCSEALRLYKRLHSRRSGYEI